jgi:hypothetical protein
MNPLSSLLEGSIRSSSRAAPPFGVVWPLLLLALFHATSASPQDVPGVIWVAPVPGLGYEYARELAVLGSEVYVATNGADSQGNTPVYLRKYGADGALGWVEGLDTGTSTYPALWADDSGVCIAGATLAKLDGTPAEAFDDAIGFVRCLAADGSPLWTSYIEPQEGPSIPQVVVYAVAGGHDAIYAVGTTSSALKDCRPDACVSSGGWDAFIQKYSRDGVLDWTRQFGGAATDYFRGVWVDEQSGEVNVWGVEYDFTSSADFEIQLLRYAGNGTLRQTATIPLGSQMPYDAGFAGSTFCLASQLPVSDPVDPDRIASDLRRYEWDKKGDLQPVWSDSVADTWVNDVVALPSGLLIAGQAYQLLSGQQGAGYYDAFVRRYDGTQESWTSQFGTPASDEASAVAVDSSRIFVVGSTTGMLEPDGGMPSHTDAYVARFAEPFEAEAGGPYSVDEGSTVTLSASATVIDYGQTLTYDWDLNGDGTFEETGQAVAYTPVASTGAPVTVRVRVTDDFSEGTAVAEATVAIANVAPIVDAGPDVILVPGQALGQTVVFTDPGADTWTAEIAYGEPSPTDVQELSDRSFTLAHSYVAAGTYTVTVTVTDSDGGVGTDSFVVTLTDGATIESLIAEVQRLIGGPLNPGQGNSLIAKLKEAQKALEVGDKEAAVGTLGAFINEVNALESAGILEGEARGLVGTAEAIIASITG